MTLQNLLEIALVLKPKCTRVNWTLTTLVATIREAVSALPDAHKGGHNQRYTIGDAGLGAFSVFFMQSPSFLDCQVRMQKARGRTSPCASEFPTSRRASTAAQSRQASPGLQGRALAIKC